MSLIDFKNYNNNLLLNDSRDIFYHEDNEYVNNISYIYISVDYK